MAPLKNHLFVKPCLKFCGVSLFFSLWITVNPHNALADGYSVTQWTIASGGQSSIAGTQWELTGTIGQWDATAPGALSGGKWQLTGGLWGAELEGRPASIFQDRFQLQSSTLSSSKAQQGLPLHEGLR